MIAFFVRFWRVIFYWFYPTFMMENEVWKYVTFLQISFVWNGQYVTFLQISFVWNGQYVTFLQKMRHISANEEAEYVTFLQNLPIIYIYQRIYLW